MKKLISYMIVFVIGFGSCAFILQKMGYLPSAEASKASLIQAISRSPASPVVKKGQNPIADAVAEVGPAVVNIDTVTERAHPFEQFAPGAPFMLPKTQEMGQGSGVIISEDGYILTNNHVVSGAKDITVRLADGRKFKARMVSRDSQADLAVLKVNATNLPTVRLGDSEHIRVGDWAIAIGNPLGLGNTVTVGVISATKRTNLPVGNRGRKIEEAIQTDAAINRGNSGGALVNVEGEVIGINTAIYTESGSGNIGIGFAIPINYAKSTVKRLMETGSKTQPYLGVIVADMTPDLAAWYEQNGFKGKGIVIWQVQPGSPAGRAGLVQGDVIISIDDQKTAKAEDLTKAIQKTKVDQVVKLSIWRAGRTQLLAVKLAELPPDLE